MASTLLRWLIPGLVTIVGGTAIAVASTGSAMTGDLLSRSSAALAGQSSWAHIDIEGRDAILTGSADSQAAVDKAVAILSSVPGLGTVTAEATLANRVSPFPFSATLSDGVVILAGGYPTEAVHQTILAAAGKASDTTQLLAGADDPTAFSAGAVFALDTLKGLDQGSARMADLSLTITGRARSAAAYQQLTTLASRIPPGVTLTASITPPVASPYVWSASYDGTGLRIEGDEPDADFADRLRAAVPPSIPVDLSLTPASGESSEFTANALTLIKSLLSLESGEASISDNAMSLSGLPATSAIADQASAAIAAIGGTAQLDAPQAADFGLTISKSAAAITLVGTVPDKATRQKLAAMAGADVTGLAVGRGAPAHFTDGLQFSLDALAHLADGQVDLKGTRLSVGGSAATPADFKAVTAMLAQAPDGFTVTAGALQPPAVEPFVWSATKLADGTISMSGFVPDEATRAALAAKISDPGSDTADLAQGAPDGFAQSAGKGLEVLALLDSGKVSFDGDKWAIEGAVDSVKKAFAADAAYSIAGLRTAGWNYALQQPALPVVAPYIWRAQKTADGAIGVSGYSPDEAFQQAVKARVPDATDQTSLAAGAPADFNAPALAGLDALTALAEGSVGLSGSTWSLSGTVADSATRTAVQAKLSAATDISAWSIAISAKDAAPVVAPYLWSATKTAGGSIAITGYVPSDTVKSDTARLVGAAGNDTTTIASGEPAGFAGDVAAGLDALSHLSAGRAMFDGAKWSLAGDVASQADGDAAIAALKQGSQIWSATLTGYTPSSSSSSVSSSASMSESSSSEAALSASEAAPASDIVSIAPLVPPSSPPASVEASSAAASSEMVSSSLPTSSEAVAASSSAASSELSAPESSSVAPPSSVASSSVPPASSSVEPSTASSSSSSAPEAPASPEAAMPPMPTALTFEATLDAGGQTVLKGSAPAASDIKALAKAAGGVSAKGLKATSGLPDGFTASATAGIAAMSKLGQGDLGFDGTRWWLRADAYSAGDRDAAAAIIAALSGGAEWSVGITVLGPLDACRAESAAIAKANAIQFTGRATLTKPSIAVIDDLAATLQNCAATNVHVQGHTDTDGGAQANLAVSVARAEAVIAELVKHGVDEGRLYAEGFGESDPIASNDTKAGKAANRRMSFEIDPQ